MGTPEPDDRIDICAGKGANRKAGSNPALPNVRRLNMKRPIITKPVPRCDECGGVMTLRRPREDQTWNAFWGCSCYPECRNTYNIDQHGNPEIDSIEPLEHLTNDDALQTMRTTT